MHNKAVLSPSAGTAIPLALHVSPKPRRYVKIGEFMRVGYFVLGLLLCGCTNTKWVGGAVVSYDEVSKITDREYKVRVTGSAANSFEDLEQAVSIRASELCGCDSYTIEIENTESSGVVPIGVVPVSVSYPAVVGVIKFESNVNPDPKYLKTHNKSKQQGPAAGTR